MRVREQERSCPRSFKWDRLAQHEVLPVVSPIGGPALGSVPGQHSHGRYFRRSGLERMGRRRVEFTISAGQVRSDSGRSGKPVEAQVGFRLSRR